MSDFFKNMNLARAIILATIPLGIFLFFFSSSRAGQVDDLERYLGNQVKTVLSSIQQLAIDHTRLSKELNSEGIRGQDNPQTYIRKVATSSKVEIGDVRISESTRNPISGIEDRIYTIRPSNSDRKYSRLKISNFLYKLEEDSSRIKVTDISIDIAQKRVKNHLVPDDEWTFTAQVTSRQAK